jgi:hypothetical protein
MKIRWPKELTTELSGVIADRISKFNVAHGAESNISQEQKTELQEALRSVFGDSTFRLNFMSKAK